MKTPQDKADELITWLREEADEGDIENVYKYVTYKMDRLEFNEWLEKGKEDLSLFQLYEFAMKCRKERIPFEEWAKYYYEHFINIKEKNNELPTTSEQHAGM